MPELPDVTIYCERLTNMFGGELLDGLRLGSPFILRTTHPPKEELQGQRFMRAERLGKRIVLHFEGGFFAAVHLMIAGRLKVRPRGAKLPAKVGLAAFDFPQASVLLTEQGTKRRASLHLFSEQQSVQRLDRGGVDPLSTHLPEFRDALLRENRTLKRALTDQRLLSGIGNAYSDEILFWAELSPVKRTQSLSETELERLFVCTRMTLRSWTEKLRREAGNTFPEKVTAFREEMAVHGRFRLPCRVCGTKIQRIRYAENETNYCPRCQTEGKLLADRSLSRILRGDWPKRIEDLEDPP